MSDRECGSWRLVSGRVEAVLDGGWHATVSSSDGVYGWSIWHPQRNKWGFGTSATWLEALVDVVTAAKNATE